MLIEIRRAKLGVERWPHSKFTSWHRTSLAGSQDSYLHCGGMARHCPLSSLARSLGFQGNRISPCDSLCGSSHRLNGSIRTFVTVTFCHPVHPCSASSCEIWSVDSWIIADRTSASFEALPLAFTLTKRFRRRRRWIICDLGVTVMVTAAVVLFIVLLYLLLGSFWI